MIPSVFWFEVLKARALGKRVQVESAVEEDNRGSWKTKTKRHLGPNRHIGLAEHNQLETLTCGSKHEMRSVPNDAPCWQSSVTWRFECLWTVCGFDHQTALKQNSFFSQEKKVCSFYARSFTSQELL